MIDNNYELILGIYLAILLFFFGYYAMGEKKLELMNNTSLNYIFIVFFLIMFFLLGYLFQNIIISLRETRVRQSNNFITPDNMKK